MPLSVDLITLGVPQVKAARAFYTSAFSVGLDLHGTGQLALHQIDALATDSGTNSATSGFRGYVLSSIVSRPAEVKALLEAATTEGATIVKPPKKQLFGEFTAVYQAPDGAVWKLAAASNKDTDPALDPPKPIETAVYLGVAKPKASKAFTRRWA